ncbi:hypothetical protein OXX79_006724 [Metschnikowia pulcherrima]
MSIEGKQAAADELVLKFEPKSMDSLDARIIQYKYALVKLERLIKAIDEVISETGKASNQLALVHYMIYLASNLFAINESGFFPKLEALENYKAPKSVFVVTSHIVTHIPYDMRDQAIVPLDKLPSVASSASCLKAFRAVCLACQDGYQKRYMNASKEIGNDAYLSDLDMLFRNEFYNPTRDFDMTFKCELFGYSSLIFCLDARATSSSDYSEASLIDIDISALFSIVQGTSRTLESQKALINEYKAIKQAPNTSQERKLQALPHSAYALHRVLFWALRLNELYFILRKFGRQIFIANHDHLHDQKFFSFVTNGARFREILNEIDANFFNTKKNGVLIATITRFLRMDSKHEITSKTVLDFVGFIHQSVVYIENLLKVLKEFGYAWLASELAFRAPHNLPIENLLKVNEVVEEERVKELKARRRRAQMLADQKAKQNSVPKPNSLPVKKVPAESLVKPKASEKSPNSNGSSKENDGHRLQPVNAHSPISKPTDFRSSQYLQRQSSSSSLQSSTSASIILEEKPNTSVINGRRRSSSQPISYNAAATALKSSNGSTPTKQEFFIRSPSGSIKRANSMTKKPLASSVTSPLSNRRQTMDVVEETKESIQPKVEVRRTASQKFQQHLLEASRSGALYSKEKETFSNVVFDPNNPSATNLRRQSKHTPLEISPPKDDPSPAKADATPPSSISSQIPTRAQITKRNTRRNSVVIQSDNLSRLSDLSRDSMISTSSQSSSMTESIIMKRVRFTGVPEYTPAEDAPASQSSKILKNFAALKISAVKGTTVKRKDEAFKREESQLFKQHIHDGEPLPSQPNGGIYAPGSQITSKFSRFKNRF